MATHNRNYGNMVPGRKVVEQSKWGWDTARKRYGSLDHQFNAPPQPKDQSQPQRLGDPNNLPDHSGVPRPFNDAANDWKLGAGKGGEGYPNFDHTRGRRK